MSLWVKRTGQVLIAALFLISCEDETFLLGFKNQNKKFGVRYQEFTLPSSVVLIDSLVTDNHDNSLNRLLIGEYVDNRFGTVRAEAFTQIYPSGTTKLDASSVYDSITLQLRLDFYSYGSDSEHEDERFRIHEITEDSITFSKRYYYNSTLGYDITPLAEVSFDVNYDTLQKNLGLSSSSQDTLLVTTRLADEFGFRLFNLALNDPSSDYSDNRRFRSKIKGLAFVPSQSNVVLGYSIASLSKLTVHYHTATNDSLKCVFFMNSVYTSTVKNSSFNNISTNRTGDLALITESYSGSPDPANTTGSRYLQSGSPVITKIDIGEYNNFIRGQVDGKDSLQNILINSAEISVDAVENPPDGLPPPSTLVLRIMNNDDLFLNTALDADSASMAGYYVASDGKYYLAGNDGFNNPTQPVTLVYDSQKKSYRGFVTLFMQNLFDRKAEDTNIVYLGLIPVSPTPGKTVSRAVFNANSIKLKIHYTAPVSSNVQ